MRFQSFIFLFIVSRSASSYVKGVSKGMQKRYQPVNGKFKCLDGSAELPYDFLNDDYCDCADGSDEPGTPACPYGTFWCRNQGYHEVQIQVMDVRDGLCNCCDGSDEEKGVCPDTCHILAAEERKRKLKIIEMLNNAHSQIAAANAAHETRARNFKTLIPEINKEFQENEEKITNLEKKRTLENDQLSNTKKGYLISWQNELKQKLSLEIFKIIDSNDDKSICSEEFEKSSIGRFFNLQNFNEIFKFPITEEYFIKYWVENFPQLTSEPTFESDQHSESQKSESEPNPSENSSEHAQDQELPKNKENDQHEHDEEIEYGEDGLPIQKALSSSQKDFNEETFKKDHPNENQHYSEPSIDSHGIYEKFKQIYQDYESKKDNPTNPEIIQIEDRIRSDEASIKDLQRNNENITRHLTFLESYDSLDFGPNRAYSLLFDICLPFEQSPFTYSICPFYKGVQERNENAYAIGYFKSWSEDGKKYTKMIFEDGDICYGDVRRSFEINLSCGSENKVKSVSEAQMCKYIVDLETPAACIHVEMPIIHDEL